MSCTKHFLSLQWEHHSWHARVSSFETLPVSETNMWGRVVHGEYVRCQKREVCEECGEARGDVPCICDKTVAEHCAVLRAFIDDQREPAP
jgi:hypothetical protein